VPIGAGSAAADQQQRDQEEWLPSHSAIIHAPHPALRATFAPLAGRRCPKGG